MADDARNATAPASAPAGTSSKRVVNAALIGNLFVAVTKFLAAFVSGSSSMLSEGIHSLVDTSNELLLLYGMRRASRTPDPSHPLGYGRELYFWSFIVALLIFALGAGVSFYQGVSRVMAPAAIEHVNLNYAVLALSFIFEAVSWRVAQRAFREAKGDLGYWSAIRRSKDPPGFMVLLEDTAALVGIVLAALGNLAADRLHMPVLDGVASILIGVVLAFTATFLARESKGLLIGERADPSVVASIQRTAEREPGVLGTNGIITVHMAPQQVVVALSVEFADELTTPQIEAAVVGLERRVRERHPEVVMVFVKPQTHAGFERSARAYFGTKE